jgi:hypothetical protein
MRGQFSLTLYPEDETEGHLFDRIKILDVAVFYESNAAGNLLVPQPAFVGVVHSKRYVNQTTDSGANRRLMVSGTSIAGLVQDFCINLDVSVSVVTEELAAAAAFSKKLTIDLIGRNKVSDVVAHIWRAFLEFSSQNKMLSNPKVADYIIRWMGADFFSFDETEFHYPIANVFNMQSTRSFHDLINGIIPYPVYEKYPCMKNGRTKIRIRESPFDRDTWNIMPYKEIDPVAVKDFDVSESDNEVYTFFYAYLDGSPVQFDKALILTAQGAKASQESAVNREKYGIYGYRPLFAHFIGYDKDNKNQSVSRNLKKLSERMAGWYSRVDEMYSGSITLETDLKEEMPGPGERVGFMGGVFYVTAAEHRWGYLRGPETIISISRGGDYDAAGGFHRLENISRRFYVRRQDKWENR